MPLTPVQIELIKEVESQPVLDNRFKNISCISADPATHQRKGAQSFVFRANDADKSMVALKFMDPQKLSEKYYLHIFDREAEILESLQGKTRCLQLIATNSSFQWQVQVQAPGGAAPVSFPIAIKYFATEWLEKDLDSYFYEQEKKQALEKLKVFRDVVLAVKSVHDSNVYHRDIKIENLRVRTDDHGDTVVLIDFGLAARLESPKHFKYNGQVGTPIFSPPEAHAGFEGERDLGKHADSYALAAILFELFNKSEFWASQSQYTDYQKVLAATIQAVSMQPSREKKQEAWARVVPLFKHAKTAPSLFTAGHTIPGAAGQILNRIYRGLAEFDFRKRMVDLELIVRLIDSAAKAVGNAQLEAARLEQKKLRRAQRIEKIRRKEARLKAFLESPSA